MIKDKVAFDKFFASTGLLIGNSLSVAYVIETVKPYGYSEDKILEGKALLEKTRALYYDQLGARGEQFGATDKFVKAWELARKAYMRALKIARVAFAQNTKADKSLVLSGPRKRDFPSWLMDAEAFYGNILADGEFLTAMASFGWTEEKLREELELVRKAASANTAQKDSMGSSRKATETRDECFNKLSLWVSAYRKILRIAFAENPQRLEMFGIVVK